MIMELQQVKQMTNDFGKKFLDTYFKSYEIIGVEREHGASRNEFIIVYTYMWKGERKVSTAVLPNKDSKDDGTCFFGDLKHFAMYHAEDKSGVRLRLQNNGQLMWPVWYTDREDFLRWKSFYDEMMRKYS